MQLRIALVAAVAAGVASAAQAADPERGRLLYENHCQVCHESTVHVREHRKARTREDIVAWATRWQAELKLDWQRADIDDVSEYLAIRFYGIEAEQ